MKLNNFIIFWSVAVIASGCRNAAAQNVLNRPSLISVVTELNDKLNMNWNKIIASEIQQDMEEVIKSLQVPVVIMTGNSARPVKNVQFNQQFLAIVNIKLATFNRVPEMVKNYLSTAQDTQILWIIYEARKEDLFNLSRENWSAGYTRILYYTDEGLFTYQPGPVISIQRIWQIQDYIERKDIIDYGQYPIKVALIPDTPRCYRYVDRSGRLITAGYFYKMIQIFAQQFNLQIDENTSLYGPLNKDAIYAGLRNKSFDMVGTSFNSINAEGVRQSDTINILTLVIIAPHPPPISKITYIHLIYSSVNEISIFLLLLFCAVAVSFIYYRQGGANKYFDLSKSALYVLASFLYQHQVHFKIKTKLQKLVFVLLIMGGFLLTNMYHAKLSSILVKTLYEAEIKEFQDLNDTSFGLFMRNATYFYLQKIPILYDIIEKKAQIVTHISAVTSELDDGHIIVEFEDFVDFALFQQQYLKTPRMYKIGRVAASAPQYFTMRPGLPYERLFNRYLKHIMQSGILSKLLYESSFDGIVSGEISFLYEEKDVHALLLSLEHFYGFIFFWFYGMILSIAVFVLECLYAKYIRRRF